MRIMLFIIILASGCKTQRNAVTASVTTDSSAYRMLDSIATENMKWERAYETLLATKSAETIIFDTLWGIKDTIINRVVFTDDGRIKSAEGRIRSVTTSRDMLASENTMLKDSLSWYSRKLQSDSTKVSEVIKYKEVVKIVRFIPWWVWLISAAGFVLWAYGLLPKRFRLT